MTVGALVLACPLQAFAASSKPNILFILGDDIGWTQTSVQMDPNIPFSKSDYHETPNLERLASQGMRFSNAYGQPMCSPGKIALLTGKSPAQNQMNNVIDYTLFPDAVYSGHELTGVLPMYKLDENKTVADWLKAKTPDYGTAMIRKDHVGATPTEYGFDLYDFFLNGYAPAGEDPHKLFSTANRANAYINDQASQDKPFFMLLAPSASHAPYEYRQSTFQYFQNKAKGARHKSDQLAADTFELDAMVGQVLDNLDAQGLSDNTYVFFTSDNGGNASARFNEPLIGGKGNIYEGGLRVPFIVRGPGIAPNSTSSVPTVGMDLFATASEIAGITAPLDPMLESASILPVLHNNGQLPGGVPLQRAFGANGELFFHIPHYSDNATPMSAIRDGDYKLIKIYAESGNPEQIMLFNIAANPTESTNVNSPLNLASQMPQKVQQMLGKLDNWLTGVDASMPQRDTDPVMFTWNASQRGEYPTQWRSTTRVKDFRSETWDAVHNQPHNPAYDAKLVATTPLQPNLAHDAYKFDGNDYMFRPFFRVSDPKANSPYDKDNSATLSMWLKIDAMDRNQLVFETGDGNSAGMSMSIGDADGDGVFNDVRVRVLGQGDVSLTATGKLDVFDNPTKRFMEVTAVISDDPANRYLDLYINGALFTHIAGIAGAAGTVNWDGLDEAGLGNARGYSSNNVGGNGGTGPRPFLGGFRGQIAEMRFANYAVTAANVASMYNAKFDAAGYRVQGVSGQAAVPGARPTDLSLGMSESAGMQVSQETRGRLLQALSVDAIVTPGENNSANNGFSSGVLAQNAEYVSYMLNFDPQGNEVGTMKQIVGSVTFSDDIIGLITNVGTLALSDKIVGGFGNYGQAANRGVAFDPANQVTISADHRTITFNLSVAGDDALQFRVLTALNLTPNDADFNNDGYVNNDDLVIWKGAFGTTTAGDANGDGVTDGADFLVWQQTFGTGPVATTAASATVPEPAAASLLAIAAVAGWAARRRQTA
ncbi:sulfatase-like hydrolase/transferase [Lacipirellula parvula]|uniref:Arylsulfatase n=1 Tax=Lacipirellula parvula TaxID=2650471 RepID=A0A5K7X685_9BACT|nr:sulfatase-like hydrolase/transferase [Lacipirellula parvula]BBO31357.1 arylsulfatase [Lacipirellula parvula]